MQCDLAVEQWSPSFFVYSTKGINRSISQFGHRDSPNRSNCSGRIFRKWVWSFRNSSFDRGKSLWTNSVTYCWPLLDSIITVIKRSWYYHHGKLCNMHTFYVCCVVVVVFHNCIVSLGFLPWEIRVAFPAGSQLRQSRATQYTVHAAWVCVSSIHWTQDKNYMRINIHRTTSVYSLIRRVLVSLTESAHNVNSGDTSNSRHPKLNTKQSPIHVATTLDRADVNKRSRWALPCRHNYPCFMNRRSQ